MQQFVMSSICVWSCDHVGKVIL